MSSVRSRKKHGNEKTLFFYLNINMDGYGCDRLRPLSCQSAFETSRSPERLQRGLLNREKAHEEGGHFSDDLADPVLDWKTSLPQHITG